MFHTVTDFNNRTVTTTILAGGGNADEYVNIEIYDDNIQEQDEVFLLYMEVGNTAQQIQITRNVSVARIRRDTDCKFNVCHYRKTLSSG